MPLILNEDYQKEVLKFAQAPTEVPQEYSSYGEPLIEIFKQMKRIDNLADRLITAYTFLGQLLTSDLISVVNCVQNDKALSPRLWMFWPTNMFRVSNF